MRRPWLRTAAAAAITAVSPALPPHIALVSRRPKTRSMRDVRPASSPHFKVAVSSLTQHPSPAVSAAGRWAEIDTSFVDIADDYQDPTHTAVTESLASLERMEALQPRGAPPLLLGEGAGGDATPQQAQVQAQVQAPARLQQLEVIAGELIALCRRYLTMDLDGTFEVAVPRELNSGPAYEDADRRLRRRRTWYAVRGAFLDTRMLLFATDPVSGTPSAQLLSPEMLYEVLVWYRGAEAQRVRARMPFENTPAALYEELDVQREVACLMRAIRDDGNGRFLTLAAPAAAAAHADRVLQCYSLCVAFGVPFAWQDREATAVMGSNATSLLVALAPVAGSCSPSQALGLLRMLSDDARFACGDDEGAAAAPATIARLLHAASLDMENCTSTDALTLLKLLLRFKESVPHSSGSDKCGGDGSLTRALELAERRALARCRQLLYASSKGKDIATEGGLVPAIRFMEVIAAPQDASDSGRAHLRAVDRRAMVLHRKLHERSAEGQRRHFLNGDASARLAQTVNELRSSSSSSSAAGASAASGRDDVLLRDLVGRFGTVFASGTGAATLQGAIDLLSMPPHAICRSPRAPQILKGIDTLLGRAHSGITSIAHLAIVLRGLAGCNYRPKCLPVLEAVALRLVLTTRGPTSEETQHLFDIALGLATIGSSAVVVFEHTLSVLLSQAGIASPLGKAEPQPAKRRKAQGKGGKGTPPLRTADNDSALELALRLSAALPFPRGFHLARSLWSCISDAGLPIRRAAELQLRFAPHTARLLARLLGAAARDLSCRRAVAAAQHAEMQQAFVTAVGACLDPSHSTVLDESQRVELLAAIADAAAELPPTPLLTPRQGRAFVECIIRGIAPERLEFSALGDAVAALVTVSSEKVLPCVMAIDASAAAAGGPSIEADVAMASSAWQTEILKRLHDRRTDEGTLALRVLQAVDAAGAEGRGVFFRDDLQEQLMMRVAMAAAGGRV